MNVSVLERAKPSIMADHDFDMNDWDHCICSHIVRGVGIADIDQITDHSIAILLLQLTPDEIGIVQRLFFWSCWPDQFKQGVRSCVSRANACRRIDYLIETNGTDEPTRLAERLVLRVRRRWAVSGKRAVVPPVECRCNECAS
jgi:hypothetical protein